MLNPNDVSARELVGGGKRQTASTIDEETEQAIIQSVKNGASLEWLTTNYPSVSPSLILFYYNNY